MRSAWSLDRRYHRLDQPGHLASDRSMEEEDEGWARVMVCFRSRSDLIRSDR